MKSDTDYQAESSVAAAELRDKYIELKLEFESDKFELAFAKMQTKESKAAVNDFFDKDEESLDLADSFKAGVQENK
jgi:hypothetical protein